jgi:hypothetical protein
MNGLVARPPGISRTQQVMAGRVGDYAPRTAAAVTGAVIFGAGATGTGFGIKAYLGSGPLWGAKGPNPNSGPDATLDKILSTFIAAGGAVGSAALAGCAAYVVHKKLDGYVKDAREAVDAAEQHQASNV